MKLDTEEKSINKISKHTKGKRSTDKRPCKFCNGKHELKNELCPAWRKTCDFCKGQNHFEKACLKKKSKHNNDVSAKHKTKQIKKLENENTESEFSSNDDESGSEFVIKKLESSRNDRRKGRTNILLKIDNKWKSVSCDLDTCADVNVVGYENLCKLTHGHTPILSKPKVLLKGFGGNPVEIMGEVKLICRKNARNFPFNFVVVDFNHGFLLSEKTCLELGLVKYCFKLESSNNFDTTLEAGRKKAQDILDKYPSVFEGYGCLPGEVSLEIDEKIKPVIQTPRRVPINLRKDLKKELLQLEKDGIIRKESEPTDWVSNMLLVKKDKNFRICIDPIPLNEAVKRPHFQSNTLDEILPEVGEAKVFSTMDAKKGFWQIKLSESSSKLTTFWTPFGRYRWLRLPFGVSPAPDIFGQKSQEIVQGLIGVEKLADDFVIFGRGKTMEAAIADHNINLENLLIRLNEFNCKLNKSKIKLCQTSVKFFGHTLTCNGLEPDPEKTSAIINMKSPSDKAALLRFLGMLTYLSRYLPDLSTSTENLKKLTRDKADWCWSRVEEDEFKKLKNLVASIETQKYFDVNALVTLECDASSTSLGAALFQKTESLDMHPEP